jgi:membrane fusion protein (multidrug efflux system)
MTKSIVGSIILVLLVLVAGAGVGWFKYQSIQASMNKPHPPEMPAAVVLGVVEPVSFRQSVTTVGTVLAPQSIELRTEVAGTIQNISIESGGIVKQGDELLKLDDNVEQAQLQGAEAMVKIAESTFRRTREAANARAVSELELDQAEAKLAQAKAEVARLEAVIRKKTLTAPFPARVGLCDLHLGQYLPEGTRITMLQGIEDFVHIDFSMPQRVADEVQVGESISLLDRDRTFHAEIVAVDSQADRLTRSIMARARLSNPPPTMQPNDSVKVLVEYGTPVQAMVVPASSLRRSPTGSSVYVVRKDDQGSMRAHLVPVTPGGTRDSKVVVFQGLSVGQTIVADGSFKLHENALLVDSNAMAASETKSDSTPKTVSGS